MTASELSYENVFDVVLLVAPEFRSVYEDHVKDNNEPLRHVLMGDLTRFVLDKCSGNRGVPSSVQPLLQLLEEGISSSDSRLSELVAVSFVENLQGEPALLLLRDSLGAGLTAQLREFEL